MNRKKAVFPRGKNRHQVRPQNAHRFFWLSCVGLVALTLVAYGRVLGNEFINLDDQAYVTENTHVKAGLTWQTVKWSVTATEQANWHPLTWMSHALDYDFYGLDPSGHHATNVILHLLSTLLLFLAVSRATGYVGRSFLLAALFAVHPFNVESVAWVAERKNVLSALFFFLTLAAYGWYARQPKWRRYIVVCLLFTAGLSAKPMLVTLPLVLLLLDYWPLQRIGEWQEPSTVLALPQFPPLRLLLEKAPLLLLSVGSSIVTVVAQRAGGAVASLEVISYSGRVENALRSYILYIWKTLWPFGFAAYYPSPFDPAYGPGRGSGMLGVASLCGILLVSATLLAWRLRRSYRYLIVGWLWFLGMLVPVIGLVQVGTQAMADRYAYLPIVGLFMILVWGVADSCEKWGVSLQVRNIASAIVLVGLTVVAYRQVGYWHDTLSLWSHTIDVTSENFVADDLMASALMGQHDPLALQYYRDAARIAPWDSISHGYVAASLQDSGRLTEAIPEYEIVVRNPPDVKRESFAYMNLGIIYSELGDVARAKKAFDRVRQKDPTSIDELVRNLTDAVTARPADEGFLRLGILLAQSGRPVDARSSLERALEMNPGRVETRAILEQLK